MRINLDEGKGKIMGLYPLILVPFFVVFLAALTIPFVYWQLRVLRVNPSHRRKPLLSDRSTDADSTSAKPP